LTVTKSARLVSFVAVAAAAFFAWSRPSGDERAIRARLDGLVATVNANNGEGLAAMAHAAEIGGYFTDDAVVDLGEGTARIVGRSTLMGMAARLQPRAAAFRLRFDDVGVRVAPGGTSADVTLTASFIQRATGPEGESPEGESMDAREFTLAMTRSSGGWQIARITAIDTLRQ
jgi:hypothetical protein